MLTRVLEDQLDPAVVLVDHLERGRWSGIVLLDLDDERLGAWGVAGVMQINCIELGGTSRCLCEDQTDEQLHLIDVDDSKVERCGAHYLSSLL